MRIIDDANQERTTQAVMPKIELPPLRRFNVTRINPQHVAWSRDRDYREDDGKNPYPYQESFDLWANLFQLGQGDSVVFLTYSVDPVMGPSQHATRFVTNVIDVQDVTPPVASSPSSSLII